MKDKLIHVLNSINPDIISSESSNLIDDGIIDSLNVMQIVTSFENEFSINFDVDDLVPENFETFDTIYDLLKKYLNDQDS